MWRYVALLLLLTPSLCNADKFSEIRETCLALDDLVSWAKAHHYLLIVDFLFGIRVAQGELEMLSQNPQSYTWSPDIVTQIHLLKNKVDRLASLAFYDMQNDTDNDYFKKFQRLVDTKYYISSHYSSERRFGSIPRFPDPIEQDPTFSEQQSDGCMREILGTEETPACTISRKCYKQMTNRESEDYQLTHQLLYLILAQVRGCSKELARVTLIQDTSVIELETTFTAKIFQRLPSVLDSGRYDLFTEMVMIGQMLNYREFYRSKILELLMLWQDSTGCYNDDTLTPPDLKNQTNYIGRKLFADEIIDDSCSEHMTALALIVLTLTLRHQLQSLPQEIVTWSSANLTLISLCGLGVVGLVVCFKKRRFRILRHFLA